MALLKSGLSLQVPGLLELSCDHVAAEDWFEWTRWQRVISRCPVVPSAIHSGSAAETNLLVCGGAFIHRWLFVENICSFLLLHPVSFPLPTLPIAAPFLFFWFFDCSGLCCRCWVNRDGFRLPLSLGCTFSTWGQFVVSRTVQTVPKVANRFTAVIIFNSGKEARQNAVLCTACLQELQCFHGLLQSSYNARGSCGSSVETFRSIITRCLSAMCN